MLPKPFELFLKNSLTVRNLFCLGVLFVELLGFILVLSLQVINAKMWGNLSQGLTIVLVYQWFISAKMAEISAGTCCKSKFQET